MSALEIVIAVVAGLCIGFAMGTVGGGGAILAVPVLVYGLHETPLQATTGSLLVVGATAVLGAVVASRQGRVDLGQGLVFGSVSIVGAAVGAWLAHFVPAAVLMACFAALMLVVAATMIRRIVRRGTAEDPPPRAGIWHDGHVDVREAATVAGVATVVGLLTGFLGVGGGFMIVPALTLVLGVPMRKASGTSLVVIAMTSVAALTTRLLTNAGVQPDWGSVGLLTGVAAVGLLAGAAVARRANNRQLSIGFAVLVTAVAVYTAIRALPALF